MKIAFPRMGQLGILLKILFRQLGIDFAEPGENSTEALKRGCRYAPEGICLPFKLILGEFMEAAEQGADTAIFLGGQGPCRFGYFGALMESILQEQGLAMRVIVLEAPDRDWGELLRRVDEACGHHLWRLLQLLPAGFWYLTRLDRWENRLQDAIARAAARQDLLAMRRIRALRFQTTEAMQAAVSFRELGQILKDSRAALEPYEAAQPPTLRVGVVGDIYSVIDTSLNRDLQWQLAERGVRTRRSMTLSGYVKESVGLSRRWSREAKPYLNRPIGGFARQTVGCAAWVAREKWDGLLQVYPLYCMPEAVAESILPIISRDYDIPVLRLVLDEHMGEEGYMTRLEAFVDLLEQRRKGHERVLSRN